MPVNQAPGGVPLPSFWQLLIAVGIGIAVHRLSLEYSRAAPSSREPTRLESVQELQEIEELASEGGAAVPHLVALLSSESRKTQRLALHGLGVVGDQAVPALDAIRERMAGDDPTIRSSALAAFSRICPDPDQLWATTAALLADPDASVRDAAAEIFDGVGNLRFSALPNPFSRDSRPVSPSDLQNLLPSVFAMAQCERPETRSLVIRVATRRDGMSDDPAVTDALRRMLDDQDGDVRAVAIAAVTARGVARVEEVREWLRDADPRVVDAALGSVMWLGPDGPQVLPELMMLVDTLPDQRLSPVIAALRSLKSDARPAVPAVLRRFNALDLSVVPDLLHIGAEPADLLPVLKPHVAPAHLEIGSQAAELLAAYFPDDARQLAARLIRKLEANEKSVTPQALQTLCGLGPAAADAVGLLIRLIETGNQQASWIEFYAVEAVGCIGPSAAPAVPCLLASLTRSHWKFEADTRQGNIGRSLGRIGPAARGAVPALLELLDAVPPSDAAERAMRRHNLGYLPPAVHVLTALGLIGDDSAPVLGRLRRELEGRNNVHQRIAALRSLVRLHRNSAAVLPDLIRALEDDSSDLRLVAACLGQIEGDRRPALAGLTNALHDGDPWVASAAALWLREFGPAAHDAVPALREISDNIRHRVPNGIRVRRRSFRSAILSSEPDTEYLTHLSLAQAARLALDAIVPDDRENLPGDSAHDILRQTDKQPR